ncbi:hypothetical protein D3C71_1087190 [compost metagenome]
MARPSPVPGTVSSSRTPRSTACARCAAPMPGPSSSTLTTIWGGCPARTCACKRTVDCAHLQALSSRLPSISCRSCASPAKNSGASGSATVMSTPRPACTLFITRTSPPTTGSSAVRWPGRCADAATRDRARCQSMWRRATCTCSRTSAASAAPSLGAGAQAAFSSTESGVFRACARLPAWVRARSTTSALRSSTALKSSTSGCISAGNAPCNRVVRACCTSCKPRCNACIGRRPTATWAHAAAASSTSRAASDSASTRVNCAVAAWVACRSAATIRRQRAASVPSARTVRSSTSKGAPCGPATSCTCTAPSASASTCRARLVSHKERERSTPARPRPSGAMASTCQYRPE